MNTLIVLGSGTSTGIPTASGDWGKANPTNPKNERLRSSIYLETDKGSKIIVDTGPDLRTQCLKNNITEINAAIITHDHADHLHGFDDLRPFCFGPPPKRIPLYTDDNCKKLMMERFSYVFNRPANEPVLGGGIPLLDLQSVKLDEKISIDKDEFEFFLLPHGNSHTMCFTHEGFGYIIDCHEIPDERIEKLKNKNLELLIIDCVTDTPHKTHLWVERTFEYIEMISPKKALLIHMGNKLDHDQLESDAKKRFSFPVTPAYDGLKCHY